MFEYKPPLLPSITSGSSNLAAVEHYLQQRREMLSILKRELTNVQNRMEQAVDKRRSDRDFEVGDKVFLKVKRFLQQPFMPTPISKLSPKYFEPYVIEAKVGKVAYKLRLPEGIHVHPMFHVSLLKRSIELGASTSPQLLEIEDELEEHLEPRAILDRRVVHQGAVPLIQVLVQWSHLQSDCTTWEYLHELLKKFSRATRLL
ncbi:uncharacterized protein LOC127787642 [Diospyros lotus]|uniref:uncharacterized protein LOC127787642 n=1 Tax=Diospyros lotus TaxID=55363 RepID=UPI00225B3FFD|nr:uncharacterized protein LOC127787642 [Diospyros lotus]